MQSCVIIRPGEVALNVRYGKIKPGILLPGMHPIGIFGTKIVRFDTRIREYEGKFNLHTEEGIEVNVDLTLTYHLLSDSVKDVYLNFGTDYKNIVIVDNLTSVVRAVGAKLKSADLIDARASMEKAIKDDMNALIRPYGFDIDLVLLQHIALPQNVVATIEAKLNSEQIAKKTLIDNEIKRKELDFVLEKQRKEAELEIIKQRLTLDFAIEKQKKEAERLLIEAEAIKKQQEIINATLTDKLLRFKSLEITRDLVKSPNSKIIITDGKSPVIVNNNK
ncbi:MAG: hypothetical protein IPJ20_17665 [Flammeovirgaceae bacterium]|nr:hypothetical protein [Flammeovirgaceae bacterium]